MSLLLEFWPYLAAAGAAAIAFWRVYAMGAKAEKAKAAERDLKARNTADDIDDAVAGRAPSENRERLVKWSK